jgi:hypothetical protein
MNKREGLLEAIWSQPRSGTRVVCRLLAAASRRRNMALKLPWSGIRAQSRSSRSRRRRLGGAVRTQQTFDFGASSTVVTDAHNLPTGTRRSRRSAQAAVQITSVRNQKRTPWWLAQVTRPFCGPASRPRLRTAISHARRCLAGIQRLDRDNDLTAWGWRPSRRSC